MAYISSIWRNKSINARSYLSSALLLLVVYLFIFYLFVPLGNKYESVGNIDRVCIIKQEESLWKKITKKSRGSQYYSTTAFDSSNSGVESCGITIWEGSHVLMHIFIGYWLDLRWSLGIGILFETWEWYEHKCENYLDILYNSIGACIGGAIRTYNQPKLTA